MGDSGNREYGEACRHVAAAVLRPKTHRHLTQEQGRRNRSAGGGSGGSPQRVSVSTETSTGRRCASTAISLTGCDLPGSSGADGAPRRRPDFALEDFGGRDALAGDIARERAVTCNSRSSDLLEPWPGREGFVGGHFRFTDEDLHTRRPSRYHRRAALEQSPPTPPHPIVGMLKFAPSLTPDGQREVTVLVLV